ncbi:cellobiose dehydrogenase, partial [Bimuria novae-zelandiae CBS 107.79]
LLDMTKAPNSTLTFLSAGSSTGINGTNVTGADLIKEHVTASHYVGSAKMGIKGDAGVVVDTDTKVYGTDNLFVVDASIHPDLPTGNTQVAVMIVAEQAVSMI